MIPLILAAALAWSAPQDKPPAKTVEERLKELEDKLSAIEKRNKALEEENQSLEKRIADGKAARENYVRQVAGGWVKRYAKPVELTEKQSSEIEELWLGWTRADLEKPADAAGWKSREEAIKGKLTGEQVPRLARAVRDELEKMAKMSLMGFVQTAKISPEHAAAFEKTVLGKVGFTEDTLLLQAHPEKQIGWLKISGTVEECLPDLASVLSEDEQSRLRDTLAKWKPKR